MQLTTHNPHPGRKPWATRLALVLTTTLMTA